MLGIKNDEDATTLSLAIGDIVDAIKRYDVEHAIEIEAESKPEAAIWVQIPAIDPAYIDQARKSLAATLASICDNEELSMLYTAALEPMWKQLSQERILNINGTTSGYLITDNAPHEKYFILVSHLQ